jgi:hypothetical protein
MELQDWQKEILAMELDIFELKPQQKEMLEDFYISDEVNRKRLEVIVDNNYYYEWDKEFLNKIRSLYLKGVNWIK